MCSTDIFLGVLALLFPPLPVWVKCGICSAESVINILLCLLGFIPGLLHAWYIIAKHPEPDWEYETLPPDNEAGPSRVAYVYVREDGSQYNSRFPPVPASATRPQPRQQSSPIQPQNYGTQGYQTVPSPSPAAPGPSSPAYRAAGPSSGAAPPNDGSVPPSYAEAVADHKIQSRD